ncbi:MAG: YgiT-type zinc finger protein [Planctomycetota bacterium]|nr:YgiT-type zinc finger protein [Planctomycetota bacterium]
MKRNGHRYAACECGGKVVAKIVTVDLRIKGRLFEFENVPVGVCLECGERVYKGPVLEHLERLARGKLKPKKTIKVPVTDYRQAMAVGR